MPAGSGRVLARGGVACPYPTGLLIVAIARMSREAAKEGELRAWEESGSGNVVAWQTAPGDCPALIYG